MPSLPAALRAARCTPRLLPLALLAAAAACRDAVAPRAPHAFPAPVTIGALQARAATTIVGAPTANGPAALRTVVTLTNRGAWALVLRMPACPLRVGGHRLAARTDAPAFTYPGTPPFTNAGACIASVVEVTIAPGATHELVATVDLAELRAAVPPGRWFLLADVRLEAERSAALAVPAGDLAL